jgi:hypothetical protein
LPDTGGQRITTLTIEAAKLRLFAATGLSGAIVLRFDADGSEPKTDPETTVSKLGHMAGRAFADFRKRMRDT